MLDDLVRESIKDIEVYVPNNYEYKYKLDANESPFNLSEEMISVISSSLKSLELNRYPDTDCIKLREALGNYTGLKKENIIVSNGSDSLIKLIMDTFINKGDIILSHEPTFVMYAITGKIFEAKYVSLESDENFNVNIDNLIDKAKELKPKLIFLCTPNNPTGNSISKEDIIKVLKNTDCIAVVDEAYIEFGGESIIEEVRKFSKLIVLRTLSKAFGLAGIRVGYTVGSEEITGMLNKVKAPYNLNSISQFIAIEALKRKDIVFKNIQFLKEERDRLYKEMMRMNDIEVFPSQSNFLLFKYYKEGLFQKFLEKGVMIRAFGKGKLRNCYRVNVGTKEENNAFINALKEIIL
jgi:histidinol-phosphate aminotransferase